MIWVALSALIAAAFVCIVWVLIGPSDGTIGRALATILLLAGFCGIAILEARLAHKRPAWFAMASTISWAVALIIGLLLIWMPAHRWDGYDFDPFGAAERLLRFLLVVLILQLVLLHARLYLKAAGRYASTFTRVVAPITLGLVAILAIMLILPLVFNEWVYFYDFYWRVVVAITILAAVGTAIIPMVTALFGARPGPLLVASSTDAAPAPASAGSGLAPWPMFIDGLTPLPMMPDGTPDWNAYHTGHPTPGAMLFASLPAEPVAAEPVAAETGGDVAEAAPADAAPTEPLAEATPEEEDASSSEPGKDA
ncbi:hypothetical protein GCM10009808_16620 [Microbacterium sediminicola]|uniref:Uncharacterized protein n=1 Tax=Microbacterium sediminicola TaxID=415210 RepID=A0ABP4U9N8_9MICO